MADIGKLVAGTQEELEAWLKDGGVLIRFAGPRLEQGGDELFDFVETARLRSIRRRENNELEGEELADLVEQEGAAGGALDLMSRPTRDALQGELKRQARAALEQSRIRVEGLERDVEQQVRTAYWRVDTARDFVASQLPRYAEMFQLLTAFDIALVIVLGAPEGWGGLDESGDGAGVAAGGIELGPDPLGDLLLLLVERFFLAP